MDPSPSQPGSSKGRESGSHGGTACDLIVVGLVGDIAGGKSTVARRLAVRGAEWIDADRLAHRCLQLRHVRDQIVDRFGEQILDQAGFIDRRKLGAAVFAGTDFRELEFLESVLHPAAFRLAVKRIGTAYRQQKPMVVLDAPLLLEADWGHVCDAIWCVVAPESMRLVRVAARGWDREELLARERRQLETAEKGRLSTQVLVNQQDRSTLLRQVDELWDFLTSSTAKKR